MSVESLLNQSNIKNFSSNTTKANKSFATANSSSIFSSSLTSNYSGVSKSSPSTKKMNTGYNSIFSIAGANRTSSYNVDTFSKPVNPETEKTSGGFFNAIKSLFNPDVPEIPNGYQLGEVKQGTVLSRAEAALSKAKQITASTERDIEEAKQEEANEAEALRQAENASNAKKTEKENNKKSNNEDDIDYAGMSKIDLNFAIMLGEPKSAASALKMLNNPYISSDNIKTLKEKFPDCEELQDKIADLEANVY